MELNPVVRRSTCDEVFDQIAGNIVRGGLSAGDSLMSERHLAEVLGVSRPIVREALQRLAHAGLIEVRQGGATTVRDYRRHAGLGILARLLIPDGQIDLKVARSVLEARLAIGPEIAALAARRASGIGAPRPSTPDDPVTITDISRLRSTVDQLDTATDPVRQQELALEFWDLLVDAADSIVFRLMFNSLRQAYEPVLAALANVLQAGPYRLLLDAVATGVPDQARRAAHDLLTPTTKLLLEAIDRMEERQ